MKLVTDVKPRGDGTVTATAGETRYVFSAGADGRLAAEVANEDHAMLLLDTGNFYPEIEDDTDPADEADAALDASQAAYDLDASDENAADLDAAQNAVNARTDAKPKAKAKAKAGKK